MADRKPITGCAIHPAIGVARIGNAPADQYYLAPEVPGRAADPGPGGFKNDKGEVRKEACRFRIYGYDQNGAVVREITASDAEITWEVQVANRKAAWYQFFNAMDLKQYALSTTYNMVTEWSLLGIVAEQKEPAGRGEPGLPGRAWVETERSSSFSDGDPTWRQLLMVEGIEPTTEGLRVAATPVLDLAAKRGQRPSDVVHPRRRDIRRDAR